MGGANGPVCSFWPCLSTFSVSENVIIYKYFLYFLLLHVGRFRAENSIPSKMQNSSILSKSLLIFVAIRWYIGLIPCVQIDKVLFSYILQM